MKERRVLHIIATLNVGGAERSLASLVTGLRSNYKHEVVCLGEIGSIGERLRNAGTPVLSLGFPYGLFGGLNALRRAVKAFQPSIVQGWMYHGNLVAYAVGCLLSTRPSVVWNVRHSLYDIQHEKPRTQHIIRINRLLASKVNAVIYNSALSQRQHEQFGFCGRSVAIPNGFDTSKWAPNAELRRTVREQIGVRSDAQKVIGHFARFHPMKDHATFLRAIGSVLREKPDVHVMLAGQGVEYSNPQLASLVDPDKRGRVHMLGNRSDIEALMPGVDIFCLSSWSEAFPNVLGEAMSCGVPCVSTDVGDSSKIVGDTGLIVPPRCPDALRAALIEAIEWRDDDLNRLRRAARQRILTHYSFDAMLKRYDDLYADCLREGAAA